MNSCNFCTHRWLIKQAEMEGNKITIINRYGWTTVLIHPQDADPFEPYPDRKDELKYFVASYMELPNHCCC